MPCGTGLWQAASARRQHGPGLDRSQAQTLWEQVKAFAGYGFNQGHATAYAEVSYRSAYLKAHWPAAFLCARMADWGGFYHQAVYIAEARRLGIEVHPPHINHGAAHFDLEMEGQGAQRKPVLWMGLGQVRDLRSSTIAALLAAREARPFVDLADLLQRVALQNKEAVHLIRCGALDGLGTSRAGLLAELARYERGGLAQMGFAFLADETPAETAAERLAWEEQLLGQPVSVHPLSARALPYYRHVRSAPYWARLRPARSRARARPLKWPVPAAGVDRGSRLFPG